MAKEEELKSVELKVSVNCCEGCKRKVIKALSIKGVLRTEIHATLPKVTVVGNVDVEVLLRKLAKAGKSAEIVLLEEAVQKPPREGGDSKCCAGAGEASDKKSTELSKKGKKDQETKKPALEEETSSSSSAGNGGDHVRGSKEAAPAPIVMAVPVLASSQARVFYPMEPVEVPLQYYAATYPQYPSPQYVVQERYYFEAAAPPVHPQETAYGDYFNDDNTVGCRIM